MKKSLLFAASFAAVLHGSAQLVPCSDAFISEIVEGWSNNKAVEIYNPTDEPLDISTYGLVRFQNGSTSYGEISYLDGVVIAPGDVYVIVLDKRDPEGTELEAPVWDELQEVADLFINPNYDNGVWPMYFNGNDAVALIKNGGNTLVDLFGKIGEGADFPGWGPYTDTDGETAYISADHTLIRKSDVQSGVTINPGSFDIQAQWDSLPANTFDHLGVHSCLCVVSTNDLEPLDRSTVQIYPNPVEGDFLSVVARQEILSVSLVDLNGRTVRVLDQPNDRMCRFDLMGVESGVYFVQVDLADGTRFQMRIIR